MGSLHPENSAEPGAQGVLRGGQRDGLLGSQIATKSSDLMSTYYMPGPMSAFTCAISLTPQDDPILPSLIIISILQTKEQKNREV